VRKIVAEMYQKSRIRGPPGPQRKRKKPLYKRKGLQVKEIKPGVPVQV